MKPRSIIRPERLRRRGASSVHPDPPGERSPGPEVGRRMSRQPRRQEREYGESRRDQKLEAVVTESSRWLVPPARSSGRPYGTRAGDGKVVHLGSGRLRVNIPVRTAKGQMRSGACFTSTDRHAGPRRGDGTSCARVGTIPTQAAAAGPARRAQDACVRRLTELTARHPGVSGPCERRRCPVHCTSIREDHAGGGPEAGHRSREPG